MNPEMGHEIVCNLHGEKPNLNHHHDEQAVAKHVHTLMLMNMVFI